MPRLYQLNCGSLNNKADGLTSFGNKNKYDFLALSETHFHKTFKPPQTIRGYTGYHTLRDCDTKASVAGGTVIYVSEKSTSHQRHELEIKGIEMTVEQIERPKNTSL